MGSLLSETQGGQFAIAAVGAWFRCFRASHLKDLEGRV